jgi:hypothetical protein
MCTGAAYMILEEAKEGKSGFPEVPEMWRKKRSRIAYEWAI